MPAFKPIRFYRVLERRSADAVAAPLSPAAAAGRTAEPTIYADAPLSRLLAAIDRRASDLELALAEYVRARRAAGILPEAMLVEFKRVLRRALGFDAVRLASDPGATCRRRLTGRLIELYFAA
jgi:hypothetical protein